MTYGDFARVIGLIEPTMPWRPWHRTQLSDVLDDHRQVEPGEVRLPPAGQRGN
jgi:hypothetical protein